MKRNNSVIGNLSVAFIANIVGLLGSTIITFLLPRFIGVTQYSYYQLYVFYASYVGFFGLGWLEGLYLRYGGCYYEKLDKGLLSAQFYAFSLVEFVFTILLISITAIKISGSKAYVLIMFALCIVIYLPRALLHNILQTTGRIKEYATGLIIDKSIHILLTIVLIMLKSSRFEYFTLSELFGRVCGGIYIFIVCKDIIHAEHKYNVELNTLLKEIKVNVSVGVPLMLANVASMLVVGIIRQMIEIAWDVETFGKVSLTLTISNLLMTFINSVALVLFPMLKRMSTDKLKSFYSTLRGAIMFPLLGVLITYYPIRVVLSAWLPKYAESLKYMALLFPMCIFECKMSLILNTYLKALRNERLLLKINVIAVLISALLGYFSCFCLKNLDTAILSIVVVLAARSIYAEHFITNRLGLTALRENLSEILLSVVFIISSWVVGGIPGTSIYSLTFIVYIVFNRNRITEIIDASKKMLTH